MTIRPDCDARVVEQSVCCNTCLLAWDIDDPEPPACQKPLGENPRPLPKPMDGPLSEPWWKKRNTYE